MKLHFEDNLDYQLEAIAAVVDLFQGQEKGQSEFSLVRSREQQLQIESGLGVGNRLSLGADEILQNLRAVQLRHALPQAERLKSLDFSVEMETGTGKTYVYLRTAFELYRHYGFSKFIIVVPSVAIREGVFKTLDITREHFEALYPQAKGYNYFRYDSDKLSQVRSFVLSNTMQFMILTVGAINKKAVNVMYQEREDLNDERPIELIQATRPILILDEPQSIEGQASAGGKTKSKGQEALQELKPLFTLRYSATHREKHNQVYRLDAIDAYQRGLVKQIEVAGLVIEDAHNKPYVRLIETASSKGQIWARIEIDKSTSNGVKRQTLTVEDGQSLFVLSGHREVYHDMWVGRIICDKRAGRHTMQLIGPNVDVVLTRGQAWGDVDPEGTARIMIERTIREHLRKEMQFGREGRRIKVLSLFFIDKVSHYRRYREDGGWDKGPYALMFEEAYHRVARESEFQTLFATAPPNPEALHGGYFSQDKNNRWHDTEENNATKREEAERAYNLIMRDKERLLSESEPLRFIFSHSALREGWDNPNVFQICVLREMGSEMQRRQTIGRGLRLCVDAHGQRVRDVGVNVLTVVANERYSVFAEQLQREIETETGYRFGQVTSERLAVISFTHPETHERQAVGLEAAKRLEAFLQQNKLIDREGNVQDKLRELLASGKLADELPDEFKPEPMAQAIEAKLRRLAGKLEIRNADERQYIAVRFDALHDPAFVALWGRIKYRTTYRVDFDLDRLIDRCAKAIRERMQFIPRARAKFEVAELKMEESGVETKLARTTGATALDEGKIPLPDLLRELQDQTQLTRTSLVRILAASGAYEDIRRNPQRFLREAVAIINAEKRAFIVEGVYYLKRDESDYWRQELFIEKDQTGYAHRLVPAQKSIYEQVVCDSEGVERAFAEELNKREEVKFYLKLPGWFTIPTPLGSYNPDWAILVERNGQEQLYFVVETKGSTMIEDLRLYEEQKIRCGRKHFESLGTGVVYRVASKLDEVLAEAEMRTN